MASVSSSTLIIFIASILVAASVAGTMTNGVQRLSGALGDRSVDVSEQIRTDVELISDPGSPSSIYDSSDDTITLLVKNTGSKTLPARPGTFDILVNGRYVSPSNVNVTVIGGGQWQTGDVARVTLERDLSADDHRIVVTVNGDEELLEFRTS
ncbi:fla cluster protein FlaG [Halobacterium hubeiense]|uniref:Fla cluster protein FlaG n=2 Tax=Halobacterium TaxID=2239 RepID=A0A0U5ADS7_9EURY|nr:flagellar protein G [Halobacterium hubeiense]CQH54839.1 fla cluster protein FlaG [Halobacterium hubeiense]